MQHFGRSWCWMSNIQTNDDSEKCSSWVCFFQVHNCSGSLVSLRTTSKIIGKVWTCAYLCSYSIESIVYYVYIHTYIYICIYMYIVRLHVQRPQQHIEIFMVTPATPVPYDVYSYYAHIHVETYGWVNTTSPPTHLLLEERSNPFCNL